ncbi:unnamed protein product [Pleuronectes platessa]|uniref:Uncharacterized protein n=1 Tax=Pleuronectes platessa TaxID=8262 RepID=A0A9N7UMU3_PLEPL|nr:unnamed protein product [Pleuronectes platessa]
MSHKSGSEEDRQRDQKLSMCLEETEIWSLESRLRRMELDRSRRAGGTSVELVAVGKPSLLKVQFAEDPDFELSLDLKIYRIKILKPNLLQQMEENIFSIESVLLPTPHLKEVKLQQRLQTRSCLHSAGLLLNAQFPDPSSICSSSEGSPTADVRGNGIMKYPQWGVPSTFSLLMLVEPRLTLHFQQLHVDAAKHSQLLQSIVGH